MEKTQQSSGGRPPPPRRLSLLIYDGDTSRAVQLARKVPVTLGRTDDADVVLADKELSRRHASFEWIDGSVVVRDLGSTNGTFFRGERVESQKLFPGDEVLLGSVTVSVHSPKDVRPTKDEPVVASASMKALYAEADRVGAADVTVLLMGETGAGKDVLARRIHEGSRRAEIPLVAVNCGALAPTLLHSQLFGHEKGAFTGADRRAVGVFEKANGGTVFLDEVGELSSAAQVSLLRVVEAGRMTRLGSTTEIACDVRVLAATNRDLVKMCDEGTFRLDLLYRLNTVTLFVPPLRERREEIVPLATHFLASAAAKHGTGAKTFHVDTIKLLHEFPWTGNVRELRNAVERAAIMARGEVVMPTDIAPSMKQPSRTQGTVTGSPPSRESNLKLKARVQQYEAQLILEALRGTGWVQTEAAKRLKVPVRTLAHKIQAYGLKQHFPK